MLASKTQADNIASAKATAEMDATRNANIDDRTQAIYHANIDDTRLHHKRLQQNPYYLNSMQMGSMMNNSKLNNPNLNNQAFHIDGQNPYIQTTTNPANEAIANNGNNNGFNSGDFIKGALIGAAATYLMTNKNVQNALFKGLAKSTSLFQAGMEEAKERFEDAKAEVQAEKQAHE